MEIGRPLLNTSPALTNVASFRSAPPRGRLRRPDGADASSAPCLSGESRPGLPRGVSSDLATHRVHRRGNELVHATLVEFSAMGVSCVWRQRVVRVKRPSAVILPTVLPATSPGDHWVEIARFRRAEIANRANSVATPR